MNDSWELKWYYFGDIITLLTEICIHGQCRNPIPFPQLRNILESVSSREELEGVYKNWPKKYPLILWMIKEISNDDRWSDSQGNPTNYEWDYNEWKLELRFRRDIDNEIIISKNKCIVPLTPILKYYFENFPGKPGDPEIVEDFSDIDPHKDLYVSTLLDSYENVFVKHKGNNCLGFRDRDSDYRKHLLKEYVGQNSGFDLPSSMVIERDRQFSDSAAISYDNNLDAYRMKFGGRVRHGSGYTRQCDEPDQDKLFDGLMRTSEYPCGAFKPRRCI